MHPAGQSVWLGDTVHGGTATAVTTTVPAATTPLVGVSATYKVTAKKISGAARVALPLTRSGPLPAGTSLEILVAPSSSGPWTPAPAEASKDGRYAIGSVAQISYLTAILVPVAGMLKQLRTTFADDTRGPVPPVAQPGCAHQTAARLQGWSITSSGPGALKWCFGLEDGHHVVKTASARSYPLVVSRRGAVQLYSSKSTLEPASSSKLAGGSRSVLMAGDHITYRLSGPGEVSSRFDRTAQSVATLRVVVEALVTVAGRDGTTTSGLATDTLDNALRTSSCGVATRHPRDVGTLLRRCLSADILDQAFGRRGHYAAALNAAAPVTHLAGSGVSALVRLKGGTRTLVVRQNQLARFADSWFRHGETLRIRTNGTGFNSFRTYDEPPTATTMYYEYDTMRFKADRKGQSVLGTVTAVRYDDGNGHRVVAPAEHSNVGDTYTYRFKLDGALNQHKGDTSKMSPDDLAYCRAGVEDSQCGA